MRAARPITSTFVNLAAYDFFGEWTHRAGHHAQLYAMGKDDPSGASGVQLLMTQGFPARKILLGIPAFGRSFLHATGAGHRFHGVGGGRRLLRVRRPAAAWHQSWSTAGPLPRTASAATAAL